MNKSVSLSGTVSHSRHPTRVYSQTGVLISGVHGYAFSKRRPTNVPKHFRDAISFHKARGCTGTCIAKGMRVAYLGSSCLRLKSFLDAPCLRSCCCAGRNVAPNSALPLIPVLIVYTAIIHRDDLNRSSSNFPDLSNRWIRRYKFDESLCR